VLRLLAFATALSLLALLAASAAAALNLLAFASTKVQILTPEELRARCSFYLLCSYTTTNTDTRGAARQVHEPLSGGGGEGWEVGDGGGGGREGRGGDGGRV
jgi:hypothetical protein